MGKRWGVAAVLLCAVGCSNAGSHPTAPRTGGSGPGMFGDLDGFIVPLPPPDMAGEGTILSAVRDLAGLSSIDFWERSGGTAPTKYTFTVGGTELTHKLPDPLTSSSKDIQGVSTEFYDVYYSNDDGAFNIDGAYLTISGVFGEQLPKGGGLNLAEIQLNFTGQPPEFGTILGSFVALGNNADATSVGNCIDGDLQTSTTMGNTVGAAAGQRLRITLGFPSTVVIQ